MAKTAERMVNRRLITYLEENNHLDHRQFAFRKGKGTGAYFSDFGYIVDQALTEEEHIDIAALDLSKAYNRVWKYGVLRKIKNIGITGNMGRFIAGFLGDRFFQVAVGNTLSKTKIEANGVPQGSVLAVTLFLVAINDVFVNLPPGIYPLVYADDIILIVTGKSVYRTRQKLQTSIRRVAKWSEKLGFQLSLEKCAISHICKQKHHPWRRPVTVNETEIPFKKNLKILGVTIDRKFNFETHFRTVKKEVKSRFQLMKTISKRHNTGNRKTLIQVGNSLVVSKLLYGLELTGRNYETMINILGPIYNNTIRLCSGLLPSTPAISACFEAGVLPFHATVAFATVRGAVGSLENPVRNTYSISTITEPIFQRFPNCKIHKVSCLHRVMDRRWNNTSPKIDWSLKQVYKVGDSPEAVRSRFLQLINTIFKNIEHAYTDGSKNDKQVGVGIAFNNCSYFYRLPNLCSIFSAEAAAIHQAILILIKTTHRSAVIFTDSASVLLAIEHGKSKHPWIQAIESKCPKNVTLCWVPGHVGILGNEEADLLANLGRRGKMLTREIPGPDVKRQLIDSIRVCVIFDWRKEHTLFLRKIKGDLDGWVDRCNRKEQNVLSRIRTGHTLVTHGQLFDGKSKPQCNICNVDLTIEHILINCPEYMAIRETYLEDTSIRNVLSNDLNRESQLIGFLKDAKLFNRI